MRAVAAVARVRSAALRLEDVELDAPRPDEVVVRVVATGVCPADTHVLHGTIDAPMPLVLGHEGAGVVEEVGSAVRSVAAGDHVVLSYASCGACRGCWGGRPWLCAHFFALNFGAARLDGSSGLRAGDGSQLHGHFFGQSAFATHVLTSERCVVAVPKDLPLDVLAPLGCGVQTGAGAVLNSLAVRPGQRLAVLGAGAVGLAAVMAGRIASATVVAVVDPNPARRALATSLGADTAVDPGAGDLAEALRAVAPGGFEAVLETSGRPEVLDVAARSLAPGGTIAFVAYPPGTAARLDPSALPSGGSLRNVVEGDAVPQVLIPQLVEHHRAGRLPLEQLVRSYPLADVNAALEDSRTGRAVKPVLVP